MSTGVPRFGAFCGFYWVLFFCSVGCVVCACGLCYVGVPMVQLRTALDHQWSWRTEKSRFMRNSRRLWKVRNVLITVVFEDLEESRFDSGSHEVNIFLDGEKLNEMPILVPVRAGRAKFPIVCFVGKRYSFDSEWSWVFSSYSCYLSFYAFCWFSFHNYTFLPSVDAKNKDDVRVDIRDPHGRSLPVQIEELPDNLVRASCRFKEVCIFALFGMKSTREVYRKPAFQQFLRQKYKRLCSGKRLSIIYQFSQKTCTRRSLSIFDCEELSDSSEIRYPLSLGSPFSFFSW